ncbi:hypothetical protein ACFFV7_29660 [Nonomuraea spiralis]|uniref:Uncharacterized protein n=1 Tax=Nonomuraea spiralis TaxID=46182 RepID=A0ABV5INS4_9ACTN|nr:hypothetical protein [Nonomuraea spiralis]
MTIFSEIGIGLVRIGHAPGISHLTAAEQAPADRDRDLAADAFKQRDADAAKGA